MIKRRRTKVVNVGGVKIGGGNPVRIQSMAKTDTRDTKKTIAQIRKLEKAGSEIIRVAVKDKQAAGALRIIKKKINIPLVADIHFDYRLALEAIENGADKIRINPGNISKPSELKAIIKLAKKRKIPMRIGINSGSLPRKGIGFRREGGEDSANGPLRPVWILPFAESSPPSRRKPIPFVACALRYINFFERQNFRDIIISLKSSNVPETVNAYKKLAVLCNYPFHLGITAAGAYDTGVVKSSIGIGALLLEGIGDTIRVSLTGDPAQEAITAKKILQALQLRNFGPDLISCPTCGRSQVDLTSIVKKLERALDSRFTSHESQVTPLRIAIMGCEVNGPGEAREADIGIAFGKDSGLLFKKGKIIKKVSTKNAVKELLSSLRGGRRPTKQSQ